MSNVHCTDRQGVGKRVEDQSLFSVRLQESTSSPLSLSIILYRRTPSKLETSQHICQSTHSFQNERHESTKSTVMSHFLRQKIIGVYVHRNVKHTYLKYLEWSPPQNDIKMNTQFILTKCLQQKVNNRKLQVNISLFSLTIQVTHSYTKTKTKIPYTLVTRYIG